MSALPTGFYGYLGPHPSGSSGCHVVFHPLDHLPLVPNDGARTQVDLLGEDALCHLGIDE